MEHHGAPPGVDQLIYCRGRGSAALSGDVEDPDVRRAPPGATGSRTTEVARTRMYRT